jgi:hypothetical protein
VEVIAMTQESEGPAPLGQSEAESANVGEPERGGGEESAAEKPDLDQREERIRTERKPAGPPLAEDEEDEESAGVEEAEPPEVDPEGE